MLKNCILFLSDLTDLLIVKNPNILTVCIALGYFSQHFLCRLVSSIFSALLFALEYPCCISFMDWSGVHFEYFLYCFRVFSVKGIFLYCSWKYFELDGRADVLSPMLHGVVFSLEVMSQRLPYEPVVCLQLGVREPERRDARAGPRHQEQSHESRRRVELQFCTTWRFKRVTWSFNKIMVQNEGHVWPWTPDLQEFCVLGKQVGREVFLGQRSLFDLMVHPGVEQDDVFCPVLDQVEFFILRFGCVPEPTMHHHVGCAASLATRVSDWMQIEPQYYVMRVYLRAVLILI